MRWPHKTSLPTAPSIQNPNVNHDDKIWNESAEQRGETHLVCYDGIQAGVTDVQLVLRARIHLHLDNRNWARINHHQQQNRVSEGCYQQRNTFYVLNHDIAGHRQYRFECVGWQSQKRTNQRPEPIAWKLVGSRTQLKVDLTKLACLSLVVTVTVLQ